MASRQITIRTVFDALSIGGGLVVAVQLCMKRERRIFTLACGAPSSLGCEDQIPDRAYQPLKILGLSK